MGGLTMTHACDKGHTDLKRSTTLIPGHTVSHCPTCGSYNVEGSPWWPVSTIDDPVLQRQLCQFADEVQERINRTNEFRGAPINDPRFTVVSTFEGACHECDVSALSSAANAIGSPCSWRGRSGVSILRRVPG